MENNNNNRENEKRRSKMTWKEFEAEIESMGLLEQQEQLGIGIGKVVMPKRAVKIGTAEDELMLFDREDMVDAMEQWGLEKEYTDLLEAGKDVLYYDRWWEQYEIEGGKRVDEMVLELAKEGDYTLFVGCADEGYNINNKLRVETDRNSKSGWKGWEEITI